MSNDIKGRENQRGRWPTRSFFVLPLVLLTLVVIGLFSTGGVVFAQTATTAPAGSTAPGAGQGFLIDKHLPVTTCASCHQEEPPAKAAPSAACVTCHEDITKSKDPEPNPHHAHIGKLSCTTCHHVHKASVVACNDCHNFNMKTP